MSITISATHGNFPIATATIRISLTGPDRFPTTAATPIVFYHPVNPAELHKNKPAGFSQLA
jgi:hypothetical protein